MDCAVVRVCVTSDLTLVVQEHRARLMGSIKTWRDLARQGNAIGTVCPSQRTLNGQETHGIGGESVDNGGCREADTKHDTPQFAASDSAK